jgi:hypothetical protein
MIILLVIVESERRNEMMKRKLKHSVFSSHSTFSLRFSFEQQKRRAKPSDVFRGFHVKLEALSLEIFIFIVESTSISFYSVAILLLAIRSEILSTL